MKKTKTYKETRFTADVLKEAFGAAHALGARHESELKHPHLCVAQDDATWYYDNVEEFFGDYRKSKDYALLSVSGTLTASGVRVEFCVKAWSHSTEVEVKAPARSEIEAIFEIFEKNAATSKLPQKPAPKTHSKPVVFIGHGRSTQWRELKDHLRDKHNIAVEAYETGARAGHTIRDILEDMATRSSFALLVLTGEDEQPDGSLRARQNVIHEAGLFQGRLGFARAIMLLEKGVQDFSNVHGVQYIDFAKGNIKETFGEVIATLRREFPVPD